MWHHSLRQRVIGCLVAIGLGLGTLSSALADEMPPGGISTWQIALATSEHVMDYSHYRVIGICIWKTGGLVPSFHGTLELDEYLPDLVVTSFNDHGDDPWTAARASLDEASYTEGSAAVTAATGFGLSHGKNPGNNDGRAQANSLIDKSVDVIGNPDPLYYFPYPSLRLDTTPFFPYFSSDADTLGILGLAELVNEIKNTNLFHYYIGQGFHDKWGYEFPRDMTATTTNDYEAAVMTAQRAADIVTNRNALHVVKSTGDTCGKNCAVSAVQEETTDRHEIWQEVYPLNRHIRPGQSSLTLPPGDELGGSDEAAGNGNYVFVIWRHYRGCQQSHGKLVYDTVDVPATKKR